MLLRPLRPLRAVGTGPLTVPEPAPGALEKACREWVLGRVPKSSFACSIGLSDILKLKIHFEEHTQLEWLFGIWFSNPKHRLCRGTTEACFCLKVDLLRFWPRIVPLRAAGTGPITVPETAKALEKASREWVLGSTKNRVLHVQ